MKTSKFYLSCAFIVITNALAINSSLLNSKVIGGHEASLKSKKFMASLRVRESHFCCGFLLTRRIVITTGSCANFYKLHGGINFNDSTVYVGIVNIDSPKGKKIIKVEHANYHPEYNPEDPIKTSGFDIGYVLLAETLQTWFPISTISLARNDVNPPFLAETYGWDYDQINKSNRNNLKAHKLLALRQVILNIVSPFRCELALSRNLTSHEYCGTEANTSDALSKKDTGSPLLKHHSKKVIGLTSIVRKGGEYHPTVFVKTKFFLRYAEGLKQTFPEDEPCAMSYQDEPYEVPDMNREYVQPGHNEASELSNRIEDCETSRRPGHTESLVNPGHIEPLEYPGNIEPSENPGHVQPLEYPGHTVPFEGLGHNEPCELAHLYEFYEQPDLSEALRPLGGTQYMTPN